jgi:intergrase/recombinase
MVPSFKHIVYKWLKGRRTMAYQFSKGWYLQELKKMGISHHPLEKRKLENYKTFVVRNLYFEKVAKKK